LQNVAAGKINRSGLCETEGNVGFIRSDERRDDTTDAPSSEIMCFEIVKRKR